MVHIQSVDASHYEQIDQLLSAVFDTTPDAQIVQLIRSNEEVYVPGLELVAIHDDKVIGTILFSKISVVGAGNVTTGLAIAPLAVHPTHQKHGIATKLVSTGLKIANELEFALILALGHNEFYRKFGFQPAAQLNLKAPIPLPKAAFLALTLQGGPLQIDGQVYFAKEFDMFRSVNG